MKKWLTILTCGISLASLTACTSSPVVKTDAGNITQQEFYNELKSEGGTQVLQNMVLEKILSKKYTATNQDITNAIKQLEQQNGITDVTELQQALAQQGMTMDDLKKQEKLQVLMFKAETDGINPTTKQLQDYFNQNKDQFIEVQASHILVNDQKTADQIETDLKNGQDFATLAKKYSTDTGSAQSGGDLGWIKKGDTVPEFENAAFSMNVGQISAPVKSQYGYHIIKLTGKKVNYSDFKSQVKQAYLQSKAKDPQTVVDQIEKDNHIQVMLKDASFKDLFKPSASPSASSGASSSSSSSSTPSSSQSSSTSSSSPSTTNSSSTDSSSSGTDGSGSSSSNG